MDWFSDLAPARQQEVLQEVAGYAMQARITAADGCAGVVRSGVKPTANPSVMICMDPRPAPRRCRWCGWRREQAGAGCCPGRTPRRGTRCRCICGKRCGVPRTSW
ncbi:DUF5958 family protein [Streptomyces sp. NPDC023327]|uniref:DUF5958 family protein n=1 Tax=Streptomyces sp. NPDC023327 TaxID=3157088 RepID=UPI0033C3FD89